MPANALWLVAGLRESKKVDRPRSEGLSRPFQDKAGVLWKGG